MSALADLLSGAFVCRSRRGLSLLFLPREREQRLTFDMEDPVSVDYSFPETAITDDRDYVTLARVQE